MTKIFNIYESAQTAMNKPAKTLLVVSMGSCLFKSIVAQIISEKYINKNVL
jgi:hypothetical protein